MHEEILRIRARPDVDPAGRREEAEMVGAIRKLVSMLSALSQYRPSRCKSSMALFHMIRFLRVSDPVFAISIEAVLPILQSITA